MLNGDSVNKVMLMGRVATEPRWQTINNLRTLHFILITSEKIKRNTCFQDHEEMHEVNIAERLTNAESIKLGKLLYVQGRVHTRLVVDDKGTKHYKAEILASSVEPVMV